MLIWEAELKNGNIVSEKDMNFSKLKKSIKSMKLYDPFNPAKYFKFDEYGKFNLCGIDLYTLVVADKEYKLLKRGTKKVIHYKEGAVDFGAGKLLRHFPVYHLGFKEKYVFEDVEFNCEYDLSYDENTGVVKLNWFLESNKTFNGKLIIQYGNKFSALPVLVIAGQKIQTSRTIGLF